MVGWIFFICVWGGDLFYRYVLNIIVYLGVVDVCIEGELVGEDVVFIVIVGFEGWGYVIIIDNFFILFWFFMEFFRCGFWVIGICRKMRKGFLLSFVGFFNI